MRPIRYLLIALMVLCPTWSWAAIAFVSVTDATATFGVATITQSVVVPSGTDRLMVVCIQTKDATTDEAATGVMFNTTEAFTLARRDTRLATFTATELWYLVNPTVTTANVVATFPNTNIDQEMAFSAVLLTGVRQVTPLDAVIGANGSSGNLSATITTVAANAWIVDCAHGSHGAGLTVGTAQTMRTDRLLNATATITGAGVSTVDGKATPGTEELDWTQASASWAISAASFAPSVDGTAGRCLLLGVC